MSLAAAGQPISARGLAWVVCAAGAIVALAIGTRIARRIAGAIVLVWLGVIVATLAWPTREHGYLDAIVLPSGERPSPLSRLFSERDVSLVGVRLMRVTRGVSGRELEAFDVASVYDAIEASDGTVTSTPFVSTVLGEQRASRFDAFVHEESARWVVFLHGYGGSFASYCWVVAHAAERAGWSTVCPATSFSEHWESGHGPAIARRTLDFVRARGGDTIVLAGLSNGGVGASRLARELEIDGLVLISGLDDHTMPIAIPTLVWHGTHDERFPIDLSRAWAERAGAQMIEVDGDHFALIEQREDFSGALETFLRGIAR
ncbi:alpha/beta fold hydrolase [Sandaracinus amylolyticus]|uniref:alpha/beta fold hydrolase n=1 Tax=Sandaracinus amylolyticus TaxID=927083 RepID=UPI001F1DF785|nr:alpha/beta hydrolase [Sandaracinus amylolyticus]